MSSTVAPAPVSKAALWTGRVLSALPVPLFLFSGVMKFSHSPELTKVFEHLGIPPGHAFGLGILELACVAVYLVPRTAVLGAILLTGYLGGAMQTHLRIGEPPFTHVLLGIVIWGGVFLRDPRLRALIPFRR